MNAEQLYREATHCLCSELEIENAVQGCLTLLRNVVPADHLVLQIYEPSLGAIRLLAMADQTSSRPLDTLVSMPTPAKQRLGDEPPTLHRPAVFNRPAEHDISSVMLGSLNMDPTATSLMVMHVLTGRQLKTGQKLGTVVLIADSPDSFTQDHADLIESLADPFGIAMANTLHYRQAISFREQLHARHKAVEERQPGASQEVVGAQFGLAHVMQSVLRVAQHDSPVLLLGETGVGKDVIANHLHQISSRHNGPMIKINCGAIPESLIDSELFGYERGAFTGASKTKRGRIERADRGTIFLDEVGELPPAVQVRLLRVLQNKEIERVGGTKTIRVDLRVIAATHRNLQADVANGKFREDLWFRLSVFPITIPPLRERRQDIPALLEFALKRKCAELKIPVTPRLAPGAIDTLLAYDWPGNVRELENVVERALVLNTGRELSFDHLDESGDSATEGERQVSPTWNRTLDEVAADHIQKVLTEVDGKIHGPGGAAEKLGINESTLRNRMKKLGIDFAGKKARNRRAE